MSLQLQRERSQPCSVGESSSSSFPRRSSASPESSGFGPLLRRSSKAARSSRRNRDTTAYTVVREQNRTREILVGERPSEASSAMCILSLLLGRLSRFISMMSPLCSWGVMVIFSMCGRFFGGWMDVASLPCHKGRPFVQLSCASI